MRLKTFELVRYGGYANRQLDFGDGEPDLHLIVGPNEAGKSTLLAAIGDLLFGFPSQTTQDWRFDYKELRLKAALEHAGEVLEVVRRKGNRNTLLGPDGAALPDDLLQPILGGLDRASFERMFGLDHAKLRAGGQAILDGRDDAARTLFEAGTGLASVGGELRRLDALTQTLFKPSASNPTINQLLRERNEALAVVRQSALSDAMLSQIETKQTEAEAQRRLLIEQAAAISARQSVLERVTRVRAPLQRLIEAQKMLNSLGALPDLPNEARELLRDARMRRDRALEQLAGHEDIQNAARDYLAKTIVPAKLLEEQARISRLEDQRHVIEKDHQDLIRRRAELEQADARIQATIAQAGLPANNPIPNDAWRKRARAYLEACRTLDHQKEALGAARVKHEQDLDQLESDRSQAPPLLDVRDVREAIEAAVPDAETALLNAANRIGELQRRADAKLASIGWLHGFEALDRASLPSPAEVAETQKQLDAARDGVRSARETLQAAEEEAATTQLRLETLSVGGTLPTPGVVDTARTSRSEALSDVLRRLKTERAEDDLAAGLTLSDRIVQADALADRRDAESQRLAEYSLASATLHAAEARAASAKSIIESWGSDLARIESEWQQRLQVSGLPETLKPSGFEAWRTERTRALEFWREAKDAIAAHAAFRDQVGVAHDRLGRCIEAAGNAPVAGHTDRLRQAKRLAESGEAASRADEALRMRSEALHKRDQELSAEAQTVLQRTTALEAERLPLTAEAKLPRSERAAIEVALEAFETASQDEIIAEGFRRQVRGMERDATAFNDAVAALLQAISRPAHEKPTDAIRALALELREALELKKEVERRHKEAEAADIGIRAAQRALDGAQATIDGLISKAHVATEAEFDPIVDACERATAARQREAEAMHELADLGDGLSLDALQAETESLPPDAVAAERDRLTTERAEHDSAREAVGRELAEAQSALGRAAETSDAAEAQQAVLDAQGALAGASERYVAVSVQAALLRWLIERHRATQQAPLLANAGRILAAVTSHAYTGLILDYDEQDRARIVALRADGARLSVERLSEGTRDQLYLALRLGALQSRYAQGTLPLICDDLLITADDRRAGLMLKVLGEAAKTLQVLVFTHHDHLVPLAETTLGSQAFRLHRLSHEPVANVHEEARVASA